MLGKIFLLGLLSIFCSTVTTAVNQGNNDLVEMREGQDLPSQESSEQAEPEYESHVVQKNTSKSRKRMSAAKIAGIVTAIVLGFAAVGFLLGLLSVPLVLILCK